MVRYELDRSKVKNRLLLALMDARGINVSELARQSGMNKATLSLALNGKYVGDSSYKKLAKFFIGEKENGGA